MHLRSDELPCSGEITRAVAQQVKDFIDWLKGQGVI